MRGFLDAQPSEEAHLHDANLSRVLRLERLQGIVQRDRDPESLLSQGDGDGLLERAQRRRQGFCPAGWNITWAKFARKSRQRNQ